jgi:hypothetical protein
MFRVQEVTITNKDFTQQTDMSKQMRINHGNLNLSLSEIPSENSANKNNTKFLLRGITL